MHPEPFAQAQQQVSHEHIQMAFEYLQEKGLHSNCGKSIPMLNHPHSFSYIQKKFCVLQFVPISVCPSHRSCEIPSLNGSVGNSPNCYSILSNVQGKGSE